MKSKSLHILPGKTNLLARLKPENKFLIALLLLTVVPFILVSHVTLVVMLSGWIVNSILPAIVAEIIPSVLIKLISTVSLYTLSAHGLLATFRKLNVGTSTDLLNYAKSISKPLISSNACLTDSNKANIKLTVANINCVNCGYNHENPSTNLCSQCGEDIYVKQQYHSCDSCGSDYDIELTDCPIC